MIISNLIALICILAVGWVVFRFGTLIAVGCAVYFFCHGQWFLAGFYVVIAGIIEAAKAGVMMVERAAGYRRVNS